MFIYLFLTYKTRLTQGRGRGPCPVYVPGTGYPGTGYTSSER